ncbi:hypothetical protein FF80_03308 [Devosia sp. LC5]|uniref:hypothetical protein n=1 Tax=Devosia sp. LC5 TaxID=1502724 RepID=UPI0004E389A5|nr:hypothetical protein [Devosia sp. LC5]KFC62741.1 hypothetical protein FF80_03308 [Devosia sp. LC5]
MVKGLTALRVPAGADPLNYRPGIKKERLTNQQAQRAAWEALSPEQKEERRQQWAAYQEKMQQWRKDFSEVGPERALQRLKDREARVAVEGDTDLNHDNVEAAE